VCWAIVAARHPFRYVVAYESCNAWYISLIPYQVGHCTPESKMEFACAVCVGSSISELRTAVYQVSQTKTPKLQCSSTLFRDGWKTHRSEQIAAVEGGPAARRD